MYDIALINLLQQDEQNLIDKKKKELQKGFNKALIP